MSLPYVTVCVWRLLVAGGNTAADIARLTRHDEGLIRRVVSGQEYADLPGAVLPGSEPDLRWHRARFELRRCLDQLDRSSGPDACWLSTGWRTSDGRAGRGSAYLGTTSLARQVLMVTSATLDPGPDLVAAHRCHEPLCGNPRCLLWADWATNAGHRRLRRLGVDIESRPDADICHLDVLNRDLSGLRFLARLEALLAQLVSGRPGHEECLVKAGTAYNDHYTTVQVRGRPEKLHRFMVAAAGRDLSGSFVLHSCDHPPCARLGHLRLGTAADNTRDAISRGRLAVGERHGRASYRDEDVATMRTAFHAGQIDLDEVRARYGGHSRTATQALRGPTYRKVAVAPVEIPVRRRLTTCGIQVVRALVAVGVDDAVVAAQVGLTPAYVRDVTAGLQRRALGGVLTDRPGPATGRRVNTGKLGPYDEAYIVARLEAGVPKRAVARELGVHARTVGRVWARARGEMP